MLATSSIKISAGDTNGRTSVGYDGNTLFLFQTHSGMPSASTFLWKGVKESFSQSLTVYRTVLMFSPISQPSSRKGYETLSMSSSLIRGLLRRTKMSQSESSLASPRACEPNSNMRVEAGVTRLAVCRICSMIWFLLTSVIVVLSILCQQKYNIFPVPPNVSMEKLICTQKNIKASAYKKQKDTPAASFSVKTPSVRYS